MSTKNNKATQRKGHKLDQGFPITKFRFHIFKPGNEPDTRTDQIFLAAILKPDKTECRKRVFVFIYYHQLMKEKTKHHILVPYLKQACHKVKRCSRCHQCT